MLPSDFITFPLKALQLQMFLDMQRVQNANVRKNKNQLSEEEERKLKQVLAFHAEQRKQLITLYNRMQKLFTGATCQQETTLGSIH